MCIVEGITGSVMIVFTLRMHPAPHQAMMAALTRLGIRFHWSSGDGGCRRVVVHGTGGSLQYPISDEPLWMGNAGTAARFLTSTLCTLPDRYDVGDIGVVTLVMCLRCVVGTVMTLALHLLSGL